MVPSDRIYFRNKKSFLNIYGEIIDVGHLIKSNKARRRLNHVRTVFVSPQKSKKNFVLYIATIYFFQLENVQLKVYTEKDTEKCKKKNSLKDFVKY